MSILKGATIGRVKTLQIATYIDSGAGGAFHTAVECSERSLSGVLKKNGRGERKML